jgi:hypothetical protein
MIRKRILLFLTTAVFFVTLGCDTATNDTVDHSSSDTIQFTEGWWKYQPSILEAETRYIQYDSNREILRAGTNIGEYPPAYLAGKKDILSFDFLSKSSTSYTFKSIFDKDLPQWATRIEQPETPFPDDTPEPGDPSNPNIPPSDTPEEPEPVQPSITGVWWLFVDGWYVNGAYEDLYAYYEGNVFIKGGTKSYQIPNSQLLLSYWSKDTATSTWIGTDYQLTDSSQYPSWAN